MPGSVNSVGGDRVESIGDLCVGSKLHENSESCNFVSITKLNLRHERRAMTTPEPSDALPVLVRLRSIRPELRPSERRVADVLLNDPASVADLPVATIAARAETSSTTVVRLMQRLGYSHLKQLRADIVREALRESIDTEGLSDVSGDIDRNDSLEDIVAKVSQAETLSIADTARTLDTAQLQRAVDAITAARRVDLFGIGASSFIGLDLQQKLNRIGRTTLNWGDPHAAWTSAATYDDQCVAIAISHSGATLDTVQYLELAAAQGATTIAITNHATSPLAAHADIVLTTAARETRFRAGALGSRIAQLMVVDCLFVGVAQHDYDHTMSAVRSTYEAVNRLKSRDQ